MGSTDQLKPDPILPDPLDLEPDHLHPDPSPDLETHLWTAELNPDIDVDHFHTDIRHDINPDLPAPIHPRFRYEHIYNYTSDPGEGSGFPDPYLESGYLDPEADLTLIHPDEIDNKVINNTTRNIIKKVCVVESVCCGKCVLWKVCVVESVCCGKCFKLFCFVFSKLS